MELDIFVFPVSEKSYGYKLSETFEPLLKRSKNVDGTGKNLASLEVVPCFGIEKFSRSDHFQSWLALHLDTELNPMNQVPSTDTLQKHFAK